MKCNSACKYDGGCPVLCEQEIPRGVEVNQIHFETERLIRKHDEEVFEAVRKREPITIVGVKYVPAEDTVKDELVQLISSKSWYNERNLAQLILDKYNVTPKITEL